MKKTKLQKAIELIREHPDLTPSEATQRGKFSKGTYFKAKSILKKNAPELNPFRDLVERLRELGIYELHYKDGKLRVATLAWKEFSDG